MNNIDSTSRTYGMEINTNKTKIMTNCERHVNNSISLHGEIIESVVTFKYLGSILNDNGSTKEILSIIAQTTASLTKLYPILNDRNLTLNYKMCLLHSFISSILLYACETWTISKELQRRITAMDFRCLRRLLKILQNYKYVSQKQSFHDNRQSQRPTNKSEREKATVVWSYHCDDYSMSKIFLQGTVNGTRKRGRPILKWSDNIYEWTGLNVYNAIRAVIDRKKVRKIVRDSLAPLRLNATR